MRRLFIITGVISPVKRFVKGGCYVPVPPEWGDGTKVSMTPMEHGNSKKPKIKGEVIVTTRNRAYVNVDCKYIDKNAVDSFDIVPIE